jgi:hypothetical protein
MMMDSLNETVEIIGRESGVEKVILYGENGSPVCENSGEFNKLFNFEEMQGKLKEILLLSSRSNVVSEEMLICMSGYKVVLNFLRNSTLILFCNEQVDFPTLKVTTKQLGKQISKTIQDAKSQEAKSKLKSSKLDKLNLRARTGTLRKSEHPILVMLKKMVLELEGPVGAIVYKKCLRVTGIDPLHMDASQASAFVNSLSEVVTPENYEQFSKRADLLVSDYFGN